MKIIFLNYRAYIIPTKTKEDITLSEYSIYRDISRRNGGDVYIGVVGPVRTGKSTFIKKFMELLVIPNIENVYGQERARDELPQSAAGKTIMTTEPKFIPNEAVSISLGDNARLKVRMIDCVGYIVDSSMGYSEDGNPRMVSTPWFDHPVPFNDAAEIGTKRVITEHSTIGLVVTTDGSFSDIPRKDYVDAENRVISELKAIKKPFIILLNSADPTSQAAVSLSKELESLHNVPVVAVNCAALNENDINRIIETVLFEFPLKEVRIDIPSWVESLENEHPLKSDLYKAVLNRLPKVYCIRDARKLCTELSECDFISHGIIRNMDLGEGTVNMYLEFPQESFFKVISEATGFEIKDDKELMDQLKLLSNMKKEYDRIAFALHEVRETGYGIVPPSTDELKLDEPKIIKQGGRFGVKLCASAPSIHMMRADIETEVNPIVGTEKQSEDLINYLMSEVETDPTKIWESNIFGKSLFELVNEGLNTKLAKMPDDSRMKLRETIERIINEGSGGLICILL